MKWNGEVHRASTVNVSSDGALVGIEPPTFEERAIGARVELESADGSSIPELRPEGKLVRLFDMDGRQFAAIRFCDYMAENRTE